MKSDYWQFNRVAAVYLPRTKEDAVCVTIQIDGRPVDLYLTLDEAAKLSERLTVARKRVREQASD